MTERTKEGALNGFDNPDADSKGLVTNMVNQNDAKTAVSEM